MVERSCVEIDIHMSLLHCTSYEGLRAQMCGWRRMYWIFRIGVLQPAVSGVCAVPAEVTGRLRRLPSAACMVKVLGQRDAALHRP
jgi:hypothetical protein